MNRDGCLIHEFIHMLSDPAEAKSPPENVALTDQGADEMCGKLNKEICSRSRWQKPANEYQD